MDELNHQANGPGGPAADAIVLDANLEAAVISRFDELVTTGEIIYRPSVGELVQDEGFNFEFRLVPHLKKKPITAANAPERKTGGGFNPFLNPEPEFVITHVGEHHSLLLNKFCVCRPSLLLTTRQFSLQDNALDASDLRAVWAVLDRLGSSYYAIYNCGYDAGSSQGHKHMQIWPYPNKDELGFELFPSQTKGEVTSDIPHVPYKHFAMRLSTGASAEEVATSHARLLEEVRIAQRQAAAGPAHNVILTQDWICLVPRPHNGTEKGAPANASGILGLVWVGSEEERGAWMELGPAKHLRYLCIPRD